MDPDTVSVGHDRVSAAYGYFLDCLAAWTKELPAGHETEHFDALRDTIYEHLLFVVIELQPGDNPQGIFESLNAQGERLLAIDLVKNQVFRRASRAGIDLERLDIDVWSARFSEEWWRADARQGRYHRPRAELFLMHWLTERTETEISATGLFVEFSRSSELPRWSCRKSSRLSTPSSPTRVPTGNSTPWTPAHANASFSTVVRSSTLASSTPSHCGSGTLWVKTS